MCYFVSISLAIISMGKIDLVALLCLSSWCLMIVCLFFTMPWGSLQFVIVVFPDHTHLLFLTNPEWRSRVRGRLRGPRNEEWMS